jgi:hypothetical protein
MATYMNPGAQSLQVMEELLESTGLTKVSEGIEIKVEGMKGPLERGYEEKLDAFAQTILKATKQ